MPIHWRVVQNRTSEAVRLKRKTDRCLTVLFPVKGSKDEIISFRVEDEKVINKLQELLQSEGILEHSGF